MASGMKEPPLQKQKLHKVNVQRRSATNTVTDLCVVQGRSMGVSSLHQGCYLKMTSVWVFVRGTGN